MAYVEAWSMCTFLEAALDILNSYMYSIKHLWIKTKAFKAMQIDACALLK